MLDAQVPPVRTNTGYRLARTAGRMSCVNSLLRVHLNGHLSGVQLNKIGSLLAAANCVDTRVVVFGHSHIPHLEDAGGLMLLNPGSATDRRREPACTIALLTIEDGLARAEIVLI